jgi:hypothetical protein
MCMESHYSAHQDAFSRASVKQITQREGRPAIERYTAY